MAEIGLLSLQGRTVLATGAAKRLGAAILEAFAACGCNAVVHYNRSESDAEALAARLREAGVDAWTVQGALDDPSQMPTLFEAATARAGPIDILVNSASIFPKDTLGDFTDEAVFENVRINTLSPVRLAQAFAAQPGALCVINMLDTMTLDYDKLHMSYHISKRAFAAFTRAMAVEYAPRVRVNAVAPGLVLPPPGQDTSYLEARRDSNPLRTIGSAEQVAAAALFLARSPFVTGQTIYVDGGRHMRGHMYE